MYVCVYIYIYIYISLDTDKDCDLLQDRPTLSTGRAPHDEQTRKCLEYNQNLVMSHGGARRQENLSDWPSVAKWLWLWQNVNPEDGGRRAIRNVFI
jgi:hypothetical protein